MMTNRFAPLFGCHSTLMIHALAPFKVVQGWNADASMASTSGDRDTGGWGAGYSIKSTPAFTITPSCAPIHSILAGAGIVPSFALPSGYAYFF
ncbi:hypothetical protein F5148DRAFT_1255623, partial [Russula earlei]